MPDPLVELSPVEPEPGLRGRFESLPDNVRGGLLFMLAACFFSVMSRPSAVMKTTLPCSSFTGINEASILDATQEFELLLNGSPVSGLTINGVPTKVAGKVNTYNRTGSTTCTMPDSTTLTVPYTLSGGAGYADTTRCNIQGGCSGSGGVDTIGVKITYNYTPFTPLGSFIGLGTTSYTLVESNAMRMEPVL